MKRLILLAIVFLITTFGASSQTFTVRLNDGNQLCCHVSDTTRREAEIIRIKVLGNTQPSHPSGDLSIPSSVNYKGFNYTVTSIGENAFAESDGFSFEAYYLHIVPCSSGPLCDLLCHNIRIALSPYAGCYDQNLAHMFSPSLFQILVKELFELIEGNRACASAIIEVCMNSTGDDQKFFVIGIFAVFYHIFIGVFSEIE